MTPDTLAFDAVAAHSLARQETTPSAARTRVRKDAPE
jgi:hypothetical protein